MSRKRSDCVAACVVLYLMVLSNFVSCDKFDEDYFETRGK